MLAIAHRRAEEQASGQSAFALGEPDAAPLATRAASWSAADRLRREFEAIGFFLSGHPLEAYEPALRRLKTMRWAEFARAARGGGGATARLGASVIDRYERRTRSGSKLGVIQLSDPSGQYEAIIFQEGLAQYRDLLEKGADVLVTLQGAADGEDVRARIVEVESLSEAAARVNKGLRVFVRDEAPLASIAELLRAKGDGEVSLVAMLGPEVGEVEVKLPGRYAVTGALAAALKAAPGVVAVEHV
jgi:DNA polymerase-3 subunit alpha